jgi:hypothetical protein
MGRLHGMNLRSTTQNDSSQERQGQSKAHVSSQLCFRSRPSCRSWALARDEPGQQAEPQQRVFQTKSRSSNFKRWRRGMELNHQIRLCRPFPFPFGFRAIFKTPDIVVTLEEPERCFFFHFV